MGTIKVSVAWASAEEEILIAGDLPADSRVSDALRLLGMLARFEADSQLSVAVFGRLVTLDTPLCDGDRVELLRPLKRDPKDVRRAKAKTAPVRRR